MNHHRNIDGIFWFRHGEYIHMMRFLDYLVVEDPDQWPEADNIPKFEGMPDYSLTRHIQPTGDVVVAIHFEKKVIMPDLRSGFCWQTKGTKGEKPAYPRF